ncbi:hypothetical protein SASPL_121985 [Salvia splendens]|uniref:Calmodulin-binding domain-containing protein n=1 Tax=Salvia splendens TaxID=180675 RepID=A0A8X8ZRM4_SALSN|nr:neurofilament heavy polypeptide-like [Salvia splendens]KAG6414612.1 hypothetical protein SASPL_121985 [Salvia splendens]
MATRRRDALPGKEKATPSPKTGAARLREVVNQISPKPKVSTAPQKQTRPAASRAPASTGVSKAVTGVTKSTTSVSKAVTGVTKSATSVSKAVTGVSKATTSVSKAQTRKPPSPATPSKPAQTRTRSLDSKTATPTHKTRIPTAVAAAAAAATGAARRASSLLVKAVVSPKVVGATAKKWKPVEKEEGKRRLSTSSSVGSGRRSSIGSKKESGCSAPVTKEQSVNPDRNEDLSICNLPEPEMQLQDIEYAYLNEADGIDDLVREDPTVPANNKTIEDNSRVEAKEKEVKVAPEEQAAVAVEYKETEPAVEKKQENSVTQRQQEKTHGKYDSPVSNDVIEETANKLRENKTNKVRALAGAFETVISLQEK